MITISSSKVLFLFLVAATEGISKSVISHQESSAQMLGQGIANGINFDMGNLLSVNNPALFDPLSVPGLYKDIATAQIFDQVAYL